MNSLLNHPTVTQTLDKALETTQNVLTKFATADKFTDIMTVAFGNKFDATVAANLAQNWAVENFATLPKIEIRPTAEINNAMGAFAKSTNTIYISQEYLTENATNPSAIAGVLLEEIGHYIDWRINEVETPGDEGAIFSALVRGEKLSEAELQMLKAEDDTATIILDGKIIEIEQANITGTSAGESINGTSGDDIINALGGNDTINGGLGNDTVDGGTGNDLLVVNYSTNTASGIYTYFSSSDRKNGYLNAYNGSTYDQVTFSSIERFNITGTTLADNIYGGANNDILNGGGGDDTIDPGAGTDTVNGGTGIDRLVVDYSLGTSAINFTASSSGTIGSAGVGQVTYSNIEQFTIAGTAYNDTLNASSYGDALNGGGGNDIINGGVGNDSLTGGVGDDTFNSGRGFDYVDGGTGNDLLVVDYSANTYGGIYTSLYTGDRTSGYLEAYNGSGYDTVNFSSIERFNITGTAGGDSIFGGVNNDTLNGGGGDDILDSGAGVDTVDGGTGTDLLVIDYATGTSAINFTGSSSGTIGSTGVGQVTYSNIEQFAIAGTVLNDTLNGANYNDTLNGGGGNDIINGFAGNDSLIGGAGDDTINAGLGQDTVDGGDGTDLMVVDYSANTTGGIYTSLNSSDRTGGYLQAYNASGYDQITFSSIEQFNITGTALNDSIYGAEINDILNGGNGDDIIDAAEGDDILNGGTGNDTLIGGDGNDTYIVDSIGDTISEISSLDIDTVQSAIDYTLLEGSNLENLTLTGSAVNATGNSLNNIITGNAAANTLNGGAGIDTLIGGAGNDTYIVDNTTDTITETATGGTGDTVQSTVDYTLVEGSNLENLTLTGSAVNATGNSLNNKLTGNNANNTLTGGAGADTLDGKVGADTMIGGTGNDIYYVDNATDKIIEDANAGTDTVYSTITFSLIALGNENLENLTLTGTAANGTGNALANTIIGNAYANTLSGGSGIDTLTGMGGNDVLVGGDGSDILTGGTGADSFRFNATTEGVDNIKDFTASQSDIIQISAAGFGGGLAVGTLASSMFLSAAGATTPTDANQRFIYNSTNGGLYFDADGNGTGSLTTQIATLTGAPALSNTNIVVI
jgi:Ca2+-binding RTX toxin-like protein